MSIRTNRMKAVPTLQKRLTTVKGKEKVSSPIVAKLDKLMSELNSIKGLFSEVKQKEDELLDTLKYTDDLLRNLYCKATIIEISNRISGEKGIDQPSSNQEAEDKKSSGKTDATIEEKLKRLKSGLDNMKAKFSRRKNSEDQLRQKLKSMEDILNKFYAEPVEDANRSETEGLVDQASKAKAVDQPDTSQEPQDKKSVENDIPIDEKFQSLESKIDKMKVVFSNGKKNEELREKLRAMEDLLRNFNVKSTLADENVKPEEDSNQSETKGLEQPSLVAENVKPAEEVSNQSETKGLEKPSLEAENVKPEEDSNQSETKGLEKPSQGTKEELPSQTSREELVEQDIKATSKNISTFSDDHKPSSSQEAQDKNNKEEDIPIDEKLESVKSELDNIKAKFSTVKENKELHNTLRALEDLLQNFNPESLAEIVKTAEDANQTDTKGLELPSQTSSEEMVDEAYKATGVDKPSSSQDALAQDNKSVEEDVPVDEKLEWLKSEIDNLKAKLPIVKKNDKLSDILTALEDRLGNSNTKSSSATNFNHASREELVDQVMETISQKIKDSTTKLGVSRLYSSDQRKAQKTVVEYPPLSLGQYKSDEVINLVLKRFQASYDALDLRSKVCCLSLSVFPENVVIKKRHIIYWWIGEGFVKSTTTEKKTAEEKGEGVFYEKKTAEEVGEGVFDELLNSNLIVPHGNGKSPIVNKFKIIPWIRHMLVSSVIGESKHPFGSYSQIITPNSHHHHDARACLVLDQHKVKISDDFDLKFDPSWRSVFNVGASYLNIEPQWMAKMKKLVVLQLGRWQESPAHHIEVDSDEFMKTLKAQKHLKYLSLRGISRISELRDSIAHLVSLQILDLKACHNLETLPSEIVLLRKLTHLDVSECYLLESMPKGIENLTELQVLKGFVVGNSNKTYKTPRISDLAELKILKRLSIHIGSEAVIEEGEFRSLRELSEVKCLKISWGVLSNKMYKDVEISLPLGLEKLHLEGFPSEETPEWLKPINLPDRLKKLYITGGKLKSMGHHQKRISSMYGVDSSTVEIVRLKYLKNMQTDLEKLKEMFPSLKYAELKKVSNHKFSEWSIDDDEVKVARPMS